MRKLTIITIALSVFAACSPSDSIDPEVEKLGRATGPSTAARPSMPPGMMGAKRQPAGEAIVYAGEILETINVPNYTYLKIKRESGEKIWAAVPQFEAEVGKPIEVEQSLVMKNFTSPSLSRTFDSIVFGTVLGTKPPMQQEGLPPGHPQLNGAKDEQPQEAAGELPDGHPPVGDSKKASPGPVKDLPPGHPPIEKSE